jgi:hypothetical protein
MSSQAKAGRWTTFLVDYAGIMLVLTGVLQIMEGIATLFNNNVFSTTVDYIYKFVLVNFLYIPYYPVWSVLIIALDLLVIWALIFHGRDVAEARGLD